MRWSTGLRRREASQTYATCENGAARDSVMPHVDPENVLGVKRGVEAIL
jgi:hypothetical protein